MIIFESNTTTFEPITTTTTTAQSNDTNSMPQWSGFIFLLGSSFFYGSNYLPVKQFESGDGMFFQLVLCIGIWIVGFVVNCARQFPTFHAFPLLGGFLWSTGNNLVVPIIKTIGIGLGLIFWGSTSLVIGWATTRFGWLGLNAEIPTNKALNYAGIVLFLLSTIFYLLVKTETNTPKPSTPSTLIPTNFTSTNPSQKLVDSSNSEVSFQAEQVENDFFNQMSDLKKRIVGIFMALFAGLLFGQCFTPILYVKENYVGASTNSLDYLFSFYTGIVITSLFYFIIYAVLKKNKPFVNNQIILPGLISGLMWGVANTCYFLSTNALSNSVSFPIASSGPQIIASLWAVFLFKEIKGLRNLGFLCGGFAVAIIGALLTGLSF